MRRGKFIAFEGGEGAGKSTQAKMLKAFLEGKGHEVILTREPGGTPAAEEIRAMLVTGEKDRWTPMSETLLFLAARAHHVEKLIKPSMAAGKWVVTDRFSLSTMVYQGVGKKLGVDKVRALSQVVLGGFSPDLTIILDVDPAIGLKRVGRRGEEVSRFEAMEIDFHKDLRGGYQRLALTELKTSLVNSSHLSEDHVAAIILDMVEELR